MGSEEEERSLLEDGLLEVIPVLFLLLIENGTKYIFFLIDFV